MGVADSDGATESVGAGDSTGAGDSVGVVVSETDGTGSVAADAGPAVSSAPPRASEMTTGSESAFRQDEVRDKVFPPEKVPPRHGGRSRTGIGSCGFKLSVC